MSVKVATYRKLDSREEYACSALEAREWAGGFADLRIEFGADRRFRWNPRCNQRPKLEGMVIACAGMNRQLRPWLLFYPIPAADYGEAVQRDFRERILPVLKEWLTVEVAKKETEIIGEELLLVELRNGSLMTHRLKYL